MKKNILLVTVCILCIWLSGCDNKKKEKKVTSKSTETEITKTVAVQKKQISIPILTSGRLRYNTEKNLSFKIGGIVQDLYVDEGMHTKEGQVLARLDDENLKEKERIAQLTFEKNKRDYNRLKKLVEHGTISQENFQSAQTAWQQALADLKIAKKNLTYSVINSPLNGKIIKKYVETNEVVSSGTPIYTFAGDHENWEVELYVTDKEIVNISIDDPATVSFDAYPNTMFNGKVSEIATTVDPQTGTYKVELELERVDLKLISGFIARVTIIPSTEKTFLVVPVDALIEGTQDKGYVYKYHDNKIIKSEIRVFSIVDSNLLVTSGLNEGDKVVVEGKIMSKTIQED